MTPALRQAVERARGARIEHAAGATGGCIGEAFTLRFADGGRAFLKTYPQLPEEVVVREAEGLRWLAQAGARVPQVLTVGDGYLLLELVVVSAVRAHPEQLGRELAALHRFGAPGFGLPTPNYLARLRQDNRPAPQWADFYRDRRLEPLLQRAAERGLVSAALRRGFDRLYERLDQLVGPPEPPARLHGDLWGGNCIVDQHGQAWLIDPAVYGGHREIDLAMMRLFGGFSARTFSAYAEAFPLAPGHEQRVPLYQLYPLLAHLVMFGEGYVSQVEQALRQATI